MVQRSGDNVTIQCVTDQLQIIWKIGNEVPDEAESYERNSSFISSTINTTVTERTTIVCHAIGFIYQARENSTIILDPLEGYLPVL